MYCPTSSNGLHKAHNNYGILFNSVQQTHLTIKMKMDRYSTTTINNQIQTTTKKNTKNVDQQQYHAVFSLSLPKL